MYVFVFLTSTTPKKKASNNISQKKHTKRIKKLVANLTIYVLKMWHESEVCWLELSLALTMPFNPKLVNLWLYGLKSEGPYKQPLRPGSLGFRVGGFLKKNGPFRNRWVRTVGKTRTKVSWFCRCRSKLRIFWSFLLLFLVPKKSWWFSAAKCRCLLSPVSERYCREKIHLTAISPHTYMYNIHFRQSKKPMTMISQFITSSRIRVFTPHIFNFKIIFESSVWINDSNRIPLHSLKLAVVAPEKIPGPNRKEPELPIIIFPELCSRGGGYPYRIQPLAGTTWACGVWSWHWKTMTTLHTHRKRWLPPGGIFVQKRLAIPSIRPLRLQWLQITELCTRKMSESE